MQPPGSPWPFGTPFGNENAFSGCGQVVAVGGSSGSIVKGLLVNALLMLCAASVQVAGMLVLRVESVGGGDRIFDAQHCGSRRLRTDPWPWYLGTVGAFLCRPVVCVACGHEFDVKKPHAKLPARKRNLALAINGVGMNLARPHITVIDHDAARVERDGWSAQ